MGSQPHKHQVEDQPVEGPFEVAAEGLLMQGTVASQVGEVGPTLVGEEHAEEFREKVALSFCNGDVVNGAHLYENEP